MTRVALGKGLAVLVSAGMVAGFVVMAGSAFLLPSTKSGRVSVPFPSVRGAVSASATEPALEGELVEAEPVTATTAPVE